MPGEVLYTGAGEIACEACGPARPTAGAGTWAQALDQRRRAYHRRWLLSGIVFGWMVAGLFVAWRVHGRTTVATIDAPAALATVAGTALVRGHVASAGMPQPLWLVVQAPDRCPSDRLFATRVVAHADGSWQSAARFSGPPGQRFLLTIVATDELANAALERAAEESGAAGGPPTPLAPGERPCRPLPGGWLDLPSGSLPLASREVVRGDELAARGDAP